MGTYYKTCYILFGDSGRIEPSTINHYRKQTKMVCRYLDGVFAKEAEGPALGFSFTIEQLEFMLAEAKRHKEGGDDGFEAILVPAC